MPAALGGSGASGPYANRPVADDQMGLNVGKRPWRSRLHSMTMLSIAGLIIFALSMLEATTILLVPDPKYSWWGAVWTSLPWWVVLALLTLAVGELADRFPIDVRMWTRNLSVHAIAGGVFAFVYLVGGLALRELLPIQGGPEKFMSHAATLLHQHYAVAYAMYWGDLGCWMAFHYFNEVKTREIATTRLHAMFVQARLDALRTQLHPHFLFNALSAIAGLASKGDRDDVVEMLGRLIPSRA